VFAATDDAPEAEHNVHVPIEVEELTDKK